MLVCGRAFDIKAEQSGMRPLFCVNQTLQVTCSILFLFSLTVEEKDSSVSEHCSLTPPAGNTTIYGMYFLSK